MAYLVKPFTADDLVPAIEVALARHEQIASLTREVADLSERLESRKAIERAKSLLQTRYRLDEPGAFRWIQKTAMDLRLSMREVAEGVVEHGPGAGTSRPE
jgi:response regulator NasT